MVGQYQKLLMTMLVLLAIAGFTLAMGSPHARHMSEAYAETVLTPRYSGEVVGPLLVDQSVCSYLRPSFYGAPLHWLTCYQCVMQARDIERIYTIAPMEGDCPSRGTVNMTFIRK